ncbi:hypothetical protein QCM77_31860 [Bradyrhizobium sp. SSUT18]|uniref:hypothetical protein n=1 Tax=unclassified Bradyrhizobium TaxID=2631580 RepID=UPI00244D085C|nr:MULTISPECIES: hypothetical protein [unclassified Bradyrhizobium]MDH2340939.1 hypothetical protein [Bradyrhizobium sp. SSUT77]MDH2354771.1 hypothetical protein [Bradyrhizobium sp. SSUT112]MDH2404514.1 hypothetical protein [Bradyrhizobium sp. SSUT18]
MAGGVSHIALCALLDEELPGDEQRSDENKREQRGRELTGIIHRTSFSESFARGTRADHRQFLHASNKLPLFPDW